MVCRVRKNLMKSVITVRLSKILGFVLDNFSNALLCSCFSTPMNTKTLNFEHDSQEVESDATNINCYLCYFGIISFFAKKKNL